jgi:hypothetical protein
MAAELSRRGVRDHRRALAGWCVGIIGYVALIASIAPSNSLSQTQGRHCASVCLFLKQLIQ